MDIYLVGGAVRDDILGLPVRERDWVVVGSTPEQMLSMGYTQVGRDFPVFLHPESREEYALARTERKTAVGHTGFECCADPDVSLEDDLKRRDLTINAIARDSGGELVDPYGGVADINDRILRHVSDAFREDPLRVLRIARFAARFASLGFTIAEETQALLETMATSGELENLTPERVWRETEKALLTDSPAVYFEVLRQCDALGVLFPEIDCLFGIPQPEKHHPEIDTGVHTLMVLEQSTLLSNNISVRLAAVLHDLGKGVTPKENWPSHHQHENLGVPLVEKFCKRIKVPREPSDVAVLVCKHHLNVHRAFELKPSTVNKLLRQLDAFRRPERFRLVLLACKADARGRTGYESDPYPQSQYLEKCLEAASAINAKQLGLDTTDGKSIGQAIDNARIEAITSIRHSYKEAG